MADISYIRFSTVVIPMGGSDVYFGSKYSDAGSVHKFATWIHTNFPPDFKVDYAESLAPGPCVVHPWQLSFRSDRGVPGYGEPEESEILLNLILTEGFLDLNSSN